ncbi:MAG: iron chelate uptake ABC transporter family permease subunit [Thermanaeromonas sp.]|uniref:FecCD family ABC transporter permease n=1 Tax=Thermanaeromonas sp. TaxID=2003697 RepID=UPI00243DE435|nr:iron chelate uptake ABC transporter family permease subunit [Thermanaeromonas sp.]MCG0278279.1 iron chelate uptake ABC transporter family permease subunit [Thermanaeromonas sp.]
MIKPQIRAEASSGGRGVPFVALEQKRWRVRLLILLLVLLLLVTAAVAVRVGAVSVPVADLLRILGVVPGSPSTLDPVKKAIILELRLPRVVLAALVGASLAMAGAAFQALFRNPMADPYVIGVSSGASLGATVAMLLAVDFRFLGVGSVPVLAFAAALGTVFLVYQLAKTGSVVSIFTLLLAGIAVGSFLSAIVSLLVYFSGERLHQVVFWLMGGFGGANWLYVRTALPYFVLGTGMIAFYARELNLLLLGEETAGYLGVEVERAKKLLLTGASLLTATAVSTSGVIGFVGLIVPHAVRMVAGPDHRFLIPASALAGATLMVAADALARTVLAPTELPVGLITALAGGPFFLYVLRNRRKMKFFS